MTDFCRACGVPFVPKQDREMHTSHFCSDCMPPIPPRKTWQEGTLDCHQYIRPYRVTDRLQEGFEMLTGDQE